MLSGAFLFPVLQELVRAEQLVGSALEIAAKVSVAILIRSGFVPFD